MTINDYLRSCNVQSVKDLTDEQVKKWFLGKHVNAVSYNSFDMAYNAPKKLRPPHEYLMKYARMAMEKGKDLHCTMVQAESGGETPSGQTLISLSVS